MRVRFLRLVVLPLLIALGASFAAYSYLSSMEANKKLAKVVTVVAASQAVPPKTALTREMLTTKSLPQEFADPAFVASVEEAIGRMTTVPLAQGEILYRSKLASKDQKSGLAYHVPAGKRAIAIPVNEVSGVAGLVEPGDRVDIICTFQKEVAAKDRTRLIAEDVPVLAVVQSMQVRESPVRDLKGYTSVTLCVSPEQAVLIGFGEKNGALKLALRAPNDGSQKGEYEVNADRFSR
ncbi:MAG: Flp pilus assembly protein CpaB [Firmicutes bacterium]|nr:Flp pilus assembly protein CpaB [Bacillota bacterium]